MTNQVDKSGRTPLHYAALEDRASDVRALVAQNENPNAQDLEGFTPLHFAAQEGALAAAAALLEGGAQADTENAYGNTPLLVAVFNSRGRGHLIELLRAHGADPRHANKAGQTPIGLAHLIANFDVARFFNDLSPSDDRSLGKLRR